MRHAILDLGTNTFNLLIVETGCNDLPRTILSRKEPVRLGEGGINLGKISDAAFKRGISAIEKHMYYINENRAEVIHAYATSAIRSAGNGLEFVRSVYQKFNIGIQIISGDREAELIYLGVRQAVEMKGKKHLIMDIGGGSNELVIADGERIYWKMSYPLGMARMLEKFRPSDPILPSEIRDIENYFAGYLDGFFEAAENYRPEVLIGSSGSFDTFRALLAVNNGDEPYCNISIDDFSELCDRLIRSTVAERMNMEGMDPMRVEMIGIAAIFVNFILRRLDISRLIQSGYALKEGAVQEILNHHILPA